MSRAFLQARMRDLLAQASILAEADGTSYEKTRTSHGKLEDVEPTMAGDPVFHTLARRFQGCVTVRDAELAVAAAEVAVEGMRRTPAPPSELLARDTVHWKREIANSDRSVTDAARFYGISRKTVYAYREKYREKAAA